MFLFKIMCSVYLECVLFCCKFLCCNRLFSLTGITITVYFTFNILVLVFNLLLLCGCWTQTDRREVRLQRNWAIRACFMLLNCSLFHLHYPLLIKLFMSQTLGVCSGEEAGIMRWLGLQCDCCELDCSESTSVFILWRKFTLNHCELIIKSVDG